MEKGERKKDEIASKVQCTSALETKTAVLCAQYQRVAVIMCE